MKEDNLERMKDIYHEAGHGIAAEILDYSAQISIEVPRRHLDPNTLVIPKPTKPEDLALIAMAGPIAEALAMNNYEDPAALAVPIELSTEALELFTTFADTVLKRRNTKSTEMIELVFKMRDRSCHSVNVGFPDFEYLPAIYSVIQIVDSICAAVNDVQRHWDRLVTIASILEKCNSYSTQQYKNLPPNKS